MNRREIQAIKNGAESPAYAVTTSYVRWVYLGLCSLGLLFIGAIYAWSIIKSPLASELGYADSQLSLNYTLMMCSFCVGSLAAGWLGRLISIRLLLTIGAVAILLGYVLTSRLNAETAGFLYLTYGMMIGGGIGVAYNTLLSVGNSWFPDKKGLCAGLLMMSFGFSTLIIGNVVTALFDMPGIGWRKTYAALGTAIAVALTLCAAILKKPASDVLSAVCKIPASDESCGAKDYSAKEMLSDKTFWIYYAHGLLAASVGSVVINSAKELTMSFGVSQALSATVVGLLSVCNGLGRIICGVGFDSMGCKKTMLTACAVTFFAPVLMLVAIYTRFAALAIFSVCLSGISYGACSTTSAAFISSFYGMKHYALNYSISNSKLLFSSFAAPAASMLYISTGTFTVPFTLLIVLSAISLGLCLMIRNS